MITTYTRKTLPKAIEAQDYLYPYTSFVSDKLRAIYTLFGWTHMLKEFHDTNRLIDNLTMSVMENLLKTGKTTTSSSAGLMVEGWFDEEDMVNIDYYFDLA